MGKVIRRINPLSRDIGEVIKHLPDDEFTIAQILAQSRHHKNVEEIRKLVCHKVTQGVLVQVKHRNGRSIARYRRIAGIPFTKSLPRGLVPAAVWELLYEYRARDPLRFAMITRHVSAYIEMSVKRVGVAIDRILRAWVRDGVVIRIRGSRLGHGARYAYQLAPGVTQRPPVSDTPHSR